MNEASRNRNKARVVGVLFLIPINFINNTILIGPHAFAREYLSAIAAHSLQIQLGMVLGIISGIISFSITVILLPIFRKHNASLAFAFLGLGVVNFITILADNTALQSLLAISQQYLGSGLTGAARFEELGSVALATRLWTHWMTILIPCASSTVFFYVVYRHKLLPRFITLWGLAGVVLMALSILLMIFGKGSYLWLMAPFGLNMFVLGLWLILKGFNRLAPDINTTKLNIVNQVFEPDQHQLKTFE